MKKKTIAKVIRLIINWVAVSYIIYRCIKPGIELYNKSGWVGVVVWVLVLISLILVVTAAFKLLTYIDEIADKKED